MRIKGMKPLLCNDVPVKKIYYTVKEVAAMKDLTTYQVLWMIEHYSIPVKLGLPRAHGRVKIHREAVQKYFHILTD